MNRFLSNACLLLLAALLAYKLFGPDNNDKDDLEETPVVQPDNDSSYVEYHSFALIGTMNNWDVSNQDYLMNSNRNSTYTYIFDNTYGEVEFKIADNKSWDWSYGAGNVKLNDFSFNNNSNIVIYDRGKYKIHLDITANMIEITQLSKYEYLETHSLSLVGTMNDWDVANDSYMMTAMGNFNYSTELIVESGNVSFKIVDGFSWEKQLNYHNVSSPADYVTGEDDNIVLTEPGVYNIDVNWKTKKVTITRVALLLTIFEYDSDVVVATLYYEEGMTWTDWLQSDYVDSVITTMYNGPDSPELVQVRGSMLTTDDSVYVNCSHLIDANLVYYKD